MRRSIGSWSASQISRGWCIASRRRWSPWARGSRSPNIGNMCWHGRWGCRRGSCGESAARGCPCQGTSWGCGGLCAYSFTPPTLLHTCPSTEPQGQRCQAPLQGRTCHTASRTLQVERDTAVLPACTTSTSTPTTDSHLCPPWLWILCNSSIRLCSHHPSQHLCVNAPAHSPCSSGSTAISVYVLPGSTHTVPLPAPVAAEELAKSSITSHSASALLASLCDHCTTTSTHWSMPAHGGQVPGPATVVVVIVVMMSSSCTHTTTLKPRASVVTPPSKVALATTHPVSSKTSATLLFCQPATQPKHP